ncbi:NifU family protein [Criibacterium bergeronii]|uniref:NifU family protein n=1 Tax=Criibacterium bergeronii TaxID=1871336 RepID=A0A371IKR1_9FIRM|nr:NifU family protein [Criibacterium bergeronii]RDY21075.1 NifU family protein [Criibacterium bergeronii]TRW28388.1 NifU family protein [Criibacterium bergeronii]
MEELLIKTGRIVDEQIRPSINSHGGDITIVGLDKEVLTIKLTGHCAGCPLSQISTAQWIEETINKSMGTDLKVKVYNEVSDELWDFAKTILRKQ